MHYINQRRDRILRFFSTRELGNFLHILGRFLTNLHRKPGERLAKHPLGKIIPSGDGAPNLQISVPCRGRTRPDMLSTIWNSRKQFICPVISWCGWYALAQNQYIIHSPGVLSCIRAGANTGATCIRTEMNSPQDFG